MLSSWEEIGAIAGQLPSLHTLDVRYDKTNSLLSVVMEVQ